MDKTGLFYRMAPGKTIAQRQKGEMKQHKTRLTVALLTNETGLHWDFMIIGQAERPRFFKKKIGGQLSFYYQSNKKAWMTSLLFQEFVKHLDMSVRQLCILLVDGGPHGMGEYQPMHVKVEVLPPNTTS